MKKSLLFALSLIASATFGQVTKNPDVEKQSSQETRITKVEITDRSTIVYFQYKKNRPKGGFQYRIPGFEGIFQKKIKGTPTIGIDPKSYLYDAVSRKKYRFIDANNIPIHPQMMEVVEDEIYRFSVEFEKLDKGVENFELIEGSNDPNSTLEHWNFFGISITNPAEKVKKEAQTSGILISGVIYDADTKLPIKGQITIYTENFNEKLDSITTSKTGSFNIALSPNDYSYKVYANGYETKEDALNLARIKTGNFVQDQYLKKIKAVEVPKAEPAKVVTYNEAKVGETIAMQNILFETSQSVLKEESFEELNKLAEAMQSNPNLTIRLEGHTDNVGDADLNLKLSYDRVTSVRNFLMNKGVEGKRMQIKGYGGSRPLNKNGNDDARKINRRVEVVILTK